jgi:DNA polymerase III epsilon subunit-like protein
MKPIIAIDCETGGLDETKHALLSIGLVELDENYNPARLKEVFIKPTLEVQGEAAKINGYSPREWAKNSALDLLDAVEQIKEWLPRTCTFIAHHSPFDQKFIETNFTSINFYPREWICTKKLYQSIAGNPCNLNIAAVKVGHWPQDYSRNIHGALIDALACAAVYKWCKQKTHKYYSVVYEKDAGFPKNTLTRDEHGYLEKLPIVAKFDTILDKLK